jgi:heat shock protein HspQ
VPTPTDKPARPRRKPAAKPMKKAIREAKFAVGQVVRHRYYPFRGVVFDIDPVFNNTEEWWAAIPAKMRPRKDQPFYHLLAENAETEYIAYVSEQNLLPDETGVKPRHPQVKEMFREGRDGQLMPVFIQPH